MSPLDADKAGRLLATELVRIIAQWEYSVENIAACIGINVDELMEKIIAGEIKIDPTMLGKHYPPDIRVACKVKNCAYFVQIDSFLAKKFSNPKDRAIWFVSYNFDLKGVPEEIAKNSCYGLHRIKNHLQYTT